MIIKKKYMTDDIIDKIMYIDKMFYKEKYTFEWYKERYSDNNIAFCLYDNDDMVGYIVAVGIKEKLYNDFKNGLLTNDYDIDPRLYDYKSKYMYIASINILKKYRHQGWGLKLLDELLQYYNNDMIAITISKEGYKLASIRMNHIMNIDSNVSVFERKNEL